MAELLDQPRPELRENQMPIYEYKCSKCESEYDIKISLEDYGKVTALCEECNIELDRYFATVPAVNIPEHMRATPGNYHGKELNVPVNIINKKKDGGYRVTRIGKKSDIHND
jgi:putative FmdB family regulatory protein